MPEDTTDISLLTPLRAAEFFTPYQPTDHERKKMEDAFAYLVAKAPFWSSIYYNEMDVFYTRAVPYAATDSYSIYLNAVSMFPWTIQQIAFVVAHEISHKFLDHLVMKAKWLIDEHVVIPGGTTLPYDDPLMGMAHDYVINAMLIDGGIGRMPPVGLFDRNISAIGMESSVEVYVKLWRQCGGKPSRLTGAGGRFDIHLMPASKAVRDSASGKLAQVIAMAAQLGDGQGNLPAGLKRFIGTLLDPKVPWQQYLRSTVLRKGGDPTYDWTKFDKRLIMREPDPIFYARRESYGAGLVVVAVDTSGSIGMDQLNRFFAEMAGIVADLRPAQLVVIWCDAAVARVDDLENPEDLVGLMADITRDGIPGGGGTDFRPVFHKVDELGMQPDMLVYLTDMYGTFPSIEPDYPVIWASITPGYKQPWGELVEVEL